MSEEECLTADWYARGVQDGRNGHGYGYIADHREACAKVGVAPDEALYRKGQALGIRDYCTPENGAREGRLGNYYRNSCPAELSGPFLVQYQAGRRVYDAEQRVRNLTDELRRKERELDSEKNDDKRKRLRREMHDLDDRLRRARDDIYDAERRLRYR